MTAVNRIRPVSERPGNRLDFETLIADTFAVLFAASPDALDAEVERALDAVRRFFSADRCALLSVSDDQRVIRVRFGAYADGVPPVSPELNLASLFPWSTHTLLVKRSAVRVESIADLPPDEAVERAAWMQLPIRSALTLPLELRGGIPNVIALNTVDHENEWPDEVLPRLRMLGETLVSALERRETLTRLRETDLRLASGADLAGLGHYTVDFGAREVFLDERFRDICGVPPTMGGGLDAITFWMEGIHPDDRPAVFSSRTALHEGRIERLSIEYRFLHPTEGLRWIHHLAKVFARDAEGRAMRTFGALRDITSAKQAELELGRLSRNLIEAHEEERAMLARELHDDVTQRLAVLAMDMGRAETAVGSTQAQSLRSIREGLVQLSEDVHALAYQLHPAVLRELGLAEALRAECERADRQGDVALSLECGPVPGELDQHAALCLFRVAQEALNNARRHARARRVRLVLQEVDGGLQLAVRDDGVGFLVDQPRDSMSLGLASMRERVLLVHGTLDIESAPNHGTSVVAWVPLPRAST